LADKTLALANQIDALIWSYLDQGELGAQAALVAVRCALEDVAERYAEDGHHTGAVRFYAGAEVLREIENG